MAGGRPGQRPPPSGDVYDDDSDDFADADSMLADLPPVDVMGRNARASAVSYETPSAALGSPQGILPGPAMFDQEALADFARPSGGEMLFVNEAAAVATPPSQPLAPPKAQTQAGAKPKAAKAPRR